MKIAMCLALACFFGAAGSAMAQQEKPDPAVNWRTVDSDPGFLAWLQHLNVPDEAVLRTRAVETTSAKAEIADLKTVIRGAFREGNTLAAQLDNLVVAVPNAVRGNDTLFVSTRNSTGQLSIRDEEGLVVLVSPNNPTSGTLEPQALENHVIQQARSLFNLPAPDQEKTSFFVSKLDLGKSKVGSIYFGKDDKSPDWIFKHWYSSIDWWSDGNRVMFAVDKFSLLHPHISRATMARPPGPFGPRKFGKH